MQTKGVDIRADQLGMSQEALDALPNVLGPALDLLVKNCLKGSLVPTSCKVKVENGYLSIDFERDDLMADLLANGPDALMKALANV
jgi:hypothetical protein